MHTLVSILPITLLETFIGIEPKTGYAQANFNINSDYACELF